MKIPKEADGDIRRLLQELTEAGSVLEQGGHGDKVLGHVSLRDPAGRGFWMKRSGISLAELEGPEDFVLVDFDGRKIAGDGVRHAEWPIHGEIFLRRSDINVIGHTHPYYAGVMATTEQPIEPLTPSGAFFAAGMPRYRETSNLIIDKQMGKDLAVALGDADAVLMRNHGITYGGATIGDCVAAGLLCEYACRDQLRASVSGLTFEPASENAAAGLRLTGEEVSTLWQSLRLGIAEPAGGCGFEDNTSSDARLAEACRVLANEGLEFLNSGLVACRGRDGQAIVGLPDLSLSQVRGPDDVLALEEAAQDHPGVTHLSALFAARPELDGAVYCRAPAVALFSACADPLAPTGDEGKHFEGAAMRLAPDEEIARIPAETRAVFLPNEGAVILGPSLEVACLRAIFLERACAVQLDAASTGLAWGWLPDSDQGVVGMTLEGQGQIDSFWNFYCRKLARAEAGKRLPGE